MHQWDAVVSYTKLSADIIQPGLTSGDTTADSQRWRGRKILTEMFMSSSISKMKLFSLNGLPIQKSFKYINKCIKQFSLPQ